jgi:hypothetical protein
MNKRAILTVLAALVFVMASAFVAQGQNARTWVSGLGNDANAPGCQQATPCRMFQTAINNTNPGGQVVALDSAGYGPFTINKSITVEGAPGAQAFIFVAPSTTAITVSSGAATDLVILRNIFVDGSSSPSTIGLSFTGSAKLVVDTCTFRSLTTGVTVTNAKMDLVNSNFYSNGNAVISNGSGINFAGNPSVAPVALVRINGGNMTGNTTGLLQQNPGTGPSSTQLVNILLFGPGSGSGGLLNLIGNTTNSTCSGTVNCNPNPFTYQTNTVF